MTKTKSLPRYDCYGKDELGYDYTALCRPDADGEWVHHEDAEREIERLTALADVQRSIDRNTAYEQDIERLTRERDGLRAALERIDAHLEVRPGREEFGDLQVSGGYGNSVSFWLAHKAARELLTHSQSEPECNQAVTAPSDAGVAAPTPRGSLPNSLGAYFERGTDKSE